MIGMVSIDTIDCIRKPAVIQSPAPIDSADTFPMKIHSALYLATTTSVVDNDLSTRSAIATVANVVVNPSTFMKIHCL